MSLAADTAFASDLKLMIGAYATATDLTSATNNFLLPADDSNQLQKIELVGHSRGAEFNAFLAHILTGMGYKNIVDYTAFDGYSSDWSSQFPNSGILTNLRIPRLLSAVPISGAAIQL